MMQGLSKEELLNRIEETARNYERDYHGCARSVMLSLQEHLNLGDDLTFQASTPLCSAAIIGGTCAAMLAGLLAVGLVTATKKMEKDEATLIGPTGPITSGDRLLRRFQKEFGTIYSPDMMKARLGRFFNLLDYKEHEQALEAGLFKESSKVVGKVSRLAAEFILELREGNKGTPK